MDRNESTEDWKYPGEVPGTMEITKGKSPFGSQGKKGCQIGKDQWFAEGCPIGVTRDDVTVPSCCFPENAPVVRQSLTVQGNASFTQNLAIVDPSDKVVLFFSSEGSQATPPTPPFGWTVVYSQSVMATLWVYCAWRTFPSAGVYPTFCDGGTQFVSIAYFVWVEDSALGVTDHSIHVQTGSNLLSANSLNAPGPVDLLFAHYAWNASIGGIVGPSGMDLVDANNLGLFACGLWQEPSINGGPTGARVLTLAAPQNGIACSVLVR